MISPNPIARFVRATAYSLTGGLLMAVGLGFLTVAGWMFLAELRDAQFAAMVIGGLYFGIGLIFMGLAKRRKHVRTVPVAADPRTAQIALMSQLVEGFVLGMTAGRAGRAKRRDD